MRNARIIETLGIPGNAINAYLIYYLLINTQVIDIINVFRIMRRICLCGSRGR